MAFLVYGIFFCVLAILANLWLRGFLGALLVSILLCGISIEIMRRISPPVPFREFAAVLFGGYAIAISLIVSLVFWKRRAGKR